MGKRKKAREQALQILFQIDMGELSPRAAIEQYEEVLGELSGEKSFSENLILGVEEKKEEIDALIGAFSQHWRMERMSPVDRCALRIAVYEFLCRDDIPPKVSINEAIELGKKFGDTESGSFINGILDAIYMHLTSQGEESRCQVD